MAIRSILHKSKLPELKLWLDLNEIEHRPGKGDWQVLQIKTENCGWQAIYEKLDSKEHYSVQDKLFHIIANFIDDYKGRGTVKW